MTERPTKQHKQFKIVLSDQDEVRVRFDLEKGQVTEFVVQYLAIIGENWQPVVRFSTAHGRPHIDISHPDGSQQTRTFPFYDYSTALTYAISYIQEHWEAWRARYEEETR
jgi:hypothetical protein